MFNDSTLSTLWGFLSGLYNWATSHNAIDVTISGMHYTLSWWDAEISLFVVAIVADVVLHFIRRGTNSGGEDA